MRNRSLFRVFLAMAASLAAVGARSETWMSGGTMHNNQMSAMYQSFNQQNQALLNSFTRNNDALRPYVQPNQMGSPSVARPSTPAKARHPLSATDFQSSGTRVAPGLLAAAIPDPAVRDEVRRGFEQSLDAFEGAARRNNAAYALAFLLGMSAQTISGHEIPDAEWDAMALTINDGLAESPIFASMSATNKQALYENSIIVAMMLGAMSGTPQTRGQAVQVASQMLVMFGGGAVAPAAPPPPSSAVAPAVAPGATGLSSFEGIYQQFRSQSPYANPSGTAETVQRTWFTFLPGGKFYGALPEEGLSAFQYDLMCARTPHWCGTYRLEGDLVRIRYLNGHETVLRRQANGTLSGGDGLSGFEQLPKMTGVRLDGQYAIVNHTSPVPIIQFRADGTFQEQLVLDNVSYKLDEKYGDPRFRALLQMPGGGTYSIRDNTLELLYSDGRNFRVVMYTVPGEGQQQQPTRIYINSSVLQRVA